MYCPRCGQQQVSIDTKFCSKCGFQLPLVAELLANNGTLPQLAALYTKKPGIFNKKNGVIFTAIWFIFFVMMMPAFFGLADIEELAGAFAVFGVFTTMMLLVISLAMLPSSRENRRLQALEAIAGGQIGPADAIRSLPPEKSTPASSYVAPQGSWRTPDTGELARPGSVTEGTTKLLNREE